MRPSIIFDVAPKEGQTRLLCTVSCASNENAFKLTPLRVTSGAANGPNFYLELVALLTFLRLPVGLVVIHDRLVMRAPQVCCFDERIIGHHLAALAAALLFHVHKVGMWLLPEMASQQPQMRFD